MPARTQLPHVLSALSLTLLAGAARAQCDFFNPPLNIDEPDAAFTDSNGDGIDGMRCGPVFVSSTGSDSNPGTIDAPLRTIQAGVLQARLMTPTRPVYVSTGNFYTGAALVFIDGVSVYGGYDATSGWTRSSARSEFNPSAVAAITGNVLVAYAQPRTGTMVLDSLLIAGKGAFNMPNFFEFSLRVEGITGAGLSLRNCDVTADLLAPVSPTPGAHGSNGANGAPGSVGLAGCTTSCSTGTNAPGGGGVAPGGAGGRGGLGAAGQAGFNGSAGASGGNPGTSASCSATAGNALQGANGISGSNGINGPAAALFANGQPGSNASNGTGGGGGGGGGGTTELIFVCDEGRGGGGGGGGAGGTAGTAGAGGTAGKSAAAVLLLGGAFSASNCAFTADAQDGSSGGNGGLGGAGGAGGPSGPGPGSTGNGGGGGSGGSGGRGGAGSGGSGGGAYSVLHISSSIPSITSSLISNTPGIGGAGGLGTTNAPNGLNGTAAMTATLGVNAPTNPALPNRAPTGVRCIIRTIQDQPSAPTIALVADPNINDSHTVSFSQPAVGGTVSQLGQSFTFFPAPGFTGWTSFSISATDSAGLSTTGTAIVFVEAEPTPPCVADVDDGSGTGTPDGGVTIDDLLYYLLRFESGC